jgi:hypothetical protein
LCQKSARRKRFVTVNSGRKLYLTDFLNRVFLGENAKNRAFYGGEKSTAVSIYHSGVNHDTVLAEINRLYTAARCLLRVSGRIAAALSEPSFG